MNRFFVLFVFFCFSFSQSGVLARFGDEVLYDYDFFQAVPHSEWVSLDSTKKELRLSRFFERELVFYDANLVGLGFFPKNFLRLHERSEQLLVNSFYENVVAKPFVDELYIKKTQQYINDRVFVHHLLLGFDGCSLSGSFSRTKEEAFFLADSLLVAFNDSSVFLSVDDKLSLFARFASLSSDDPSVVQNSGAIGWVSWGQVMPSFQDVAFSSPLLSVSSPVLTDYGYHLIFVEKRGFSDYYYYNKDLLGGFSYKFGLQKAPIDSLRAAAGLFDSLYIKEGNLRVNDVFLDEIFLLIDKKTRVEKLRGGKNVYIDWLESLLASRQVLFVFQNKGFGVGWFINKLKKTPPTRIPSIRNREDLLVLLNSFLLRDGALFGGYEKKLHKTFLYKKELLEQSKNILYKNYIDWRVSSLLPVDSLIVRRFYDNGIYRGDYISPRRVVFTEIVFNDSLSAWNVYGDFLSGLFFDDLVLNYKGVLQKPLFEGAGGVLGDVLFGLEVGQVSVPVENLNGSFSLVRVESFKEAVPFELKHVYSQIEKKIKKEAKDSIKNHLGDDLKKRFDISVFEGVLSF